MYNLGTYELKNYIQNYNDNKDKSLCALLTDEKLELALKHELPISEIPSGIGMYELEMELYRREREKEEAEKREKQCRINDQYRDLINKTREKLLKDDRFKFKVIDDSGQEFYLTSLYQSSLFEKTMVFQTYKKRYDNHLKTEFRFVDEVECTVYWPESNNRKSNDNQYDKIHSQLAVGVIIILFILGICSFIN